MIKTTIPIMALIMIVGTQRIEVDVEKSQSLLEIGKDLQGFIRTEQVFIRPHNCLREPHL